MLTRHVFFFGLALFAISFIGYSHAYRVHTTPEYRDDFHIPRYPQPGLDFGLAMHWVQEIAAGHVSNVMFPPAALVAYVPFNQFAYPGNYFFHTFLLLLALSLAVYFSLIESRILRGKMSFLFTAAVMAVIYNTAWFQLELERGNSNSFVSLLCAAGLLAVSRGRPMLATLLFSAATQYRIYPAILMAFVFLRGGIRPMIVYFVINTAALFALGVANLKEFIRNILYWQNRVMEYEYCHSLATAGYLFHFAPYVKFLKILMIVLFFACALVVWLARRRDSGAPWRAPFTVAEAGLIGVSFQLMDLLPNVSWDYKLGIQTIPFLILITRRDWRKICTPTVWMSVVGSVAVSYGFICSPGFQPKSVGLFVCLFAYTGAVVIGLLGKSRRAVKPEAAPVPPPSEPELA